MPAYITGYKGFTICASVHKFGSRFAGSVKIGREGRDGGSPFTPEWTDFPVSEAETSVRLQLYAKNIIDGRVPGRSVDGL